MNDASKLELDRTIRFLCEVSPEFAEAFPKAVANIRGAKPSEKTKLVRQVSVLELEDPNKSTQELAKLAASGYVYFEKA